MQWCYGPLFHSFTLFPFVVSFLSVAFFCSLWSHVCEWCWIYLVPVSIWQGTPTFWYNWCSMEHSCSQSGETHFIFTSKNQMYEETGVKKNPVPANQDNQVCCLCGWFQSANEMSLWNVAHSHWFMIGMRVTHSYVL